MAKTAVVNGRRRRRSSGGSKRRRRRNYGAAAAVNPRRRRRRRNYGAAAAVNPRRRRRRRNENPISPYSGGASYRQTNGLGSQLLYQLLVCMPAATAGVLAGRFAVKQAGEFKDGEPGFWHAAAGYLGSNLAGMLLSSIFGRGVGSCAIIGGLGYTGDLFTRKVLMKDSKFLQENFNLAGVDVDAGSLYGFQQQSALGSGWTDSAGNSYVPSADGGWALAGVGQEGEGQIFQAPDGTLYQLSGESSGGDGSVLAGFQQQSALGMPPAMANPNSSFGYSP